MDQHSSKEKPPKNTFRKREAFSFLLVSIFITVPLYDALLLFCSSSYQLFCHIVVATQITLAVGVILFMVKKNIPFSTFGLTTNGWRKAIIESLLASVPLIVLILLSKKFFVPDAETYNKSFFNPSLLNWSVAGYIVIAMIQEFFVRGISMTVIENVLYGKYRSFLAILITAVLFAALHSPFSPWFAFSAFVCGLMWGWLYSRHRTIIGVGISHFIVGNVAYFAGLWNYLLGK